MEILILLLFAAGFGYAIFKLAKSKNREPIGWILGGLLLSPIIVLIILAIMPSLPGKKKISKKRKKSKR